MNTWCLGPFVHIGTRVGFRGPYVVHIFLQVMGSFGQYPRGCVREDGGTLGFSLPELSGRGQKYTIGQMETLCTRKQEGTADLCDHGKEGGGV